MRRAGDGFLVECWIKPPPLDGTVASVIPFAYAGGTEPYLPVLRVGSGDGNHDAATPAFLGLNLRPIFFQIQRDDTLPAGGVPGQLDRGLDRLGAALDDFRTLPAAAFVAKHGGR